MNNPPQVSITPDGPFEIEGDLPITPKRMVVSELGEPLTWATDDPLPHDSPTRLCRCGQSKTKPFCDDTHLTIDFDGTESATREHYWGRHKTYEGPGMNIHRVGDLCAHASFCANQITDWYQMLSSTDDTNVRTEVIGMVEHCPSGALVYEIVGEIIEPDLPSAVSPVENGPLWVTGNVTIVGSDGTALETRNRVELCRCGHSKNKPFCDGTHAEIGFLAIDGDAGLPSAVPAGTEPGETSAGPYRTVVLGVHPETSEVTYAVAAMVAKAASSELSVIYGGVAGETAGDQVLTQALRRAEWAGLSPEQLSAQARSESPATALTLVAQDNDAGLIIVGRGGDRPVRTAKQVMQRAPCDVLVVAPRDTDLGDHYRRILVATDGSATADRAARRGYDLAGALGASVDLVFVGHPATGELIVSDTISTWGTDVPTDVHLLVGNPAKGILQAAKEADADLIVVGNQGMARSRMLPGESVPGAVLTGARSDVLLCRTVRQRVSELEPGDGGVIEQHGEQFAAFVDDDGEIHLMSARCPHLGCVVAWNPADKKFDCPCHGSRFSPLGEVVEGPAVKGLRPL
jgi:CDGSH-type Zn-finger protein/nitrite reductase/ring-hydroxylating ferredoxin subunit